MTREHKLALIIGFSLVLVVGVLISDHFSRARVDQMATVTEDGPSNFGSGLDGLRAVTVPQTTIASSRGATLFSNPEVQLPPVDEPQPTRPTEITLGMGNPFANIPAAINSPDPNIAEPGVAPAPHAGAVRAVNPELMRGQGVQGGMGGEPIPGFTPEPPVTVPVTPKEEVINGVPRSMLTRHDVKDGESVYRIAAEKYGDGNLWTKLRDFNPGKIASNGSMRAGVTLLCPPKEYMLGKPLPTGVPQAIPTGKPAIPVPTAVVNGKTGGKVDAVKPETKAPKGEKTTKTGTYKVQRGDLLGEIAAKTLGSSKRANEIYELNKDLMSDEDSLTVGMTLKLPTR